jgi:hypothetical protein
LVPWLGALTQQLVETMLPVKALRSSPLISQPWLVCSVV